MAYLEFKNDESAILKGRTSQKPRTDLVAGTPVEESKQVSQARRQSTGKKNSPTKRKQRAEVDLEGNACPRCIARQEEASAVHDVRAFYCDVGMRSVLRAIRRHLIKNLHDKPPKNCDYSDWSQAFKDACSTFYLEKVLGASDAERTRNLTQEEQATMINQAFQVFLDNAVQQEPADVTEA